MRLVNIPPAREGVETSSFIPLSKSNPCAVTVFFAQLLAVYGEGFTLHLLSLMLLSYRIPLKFLNGQDQILRKICMTSYGHPLDRALVNKTIYLDILEQLIFKKDNVKGGLRKSPLIKDLSLEWISENKDFFINAIKNSIVKEDFEFSLMKRIDLNTNGKIREIYITNFADRILLMGIQNLISLELSNFHSPHLFSFRKGYGPKKAATTLSKFIKTKYETKAKTKELFFIGRDVSSYGDSIDHKVMDDILDAIPELKKSSLILPLIKKSYRAEFYSGPDQQIAACLRKGIPSGSPVVPLLENIYL